MTHQKRLNSFLSDLVSNYAKHDGDVYNLSLDDLPEDEQGNLASHYLETIDREVNECVYGNDFTINSDYTCALLKMLKDPTPENRDDFARLVNKNVIVYFHESLQSLIDEACNDYLHEEMNDAGYYAHIDRNHGDLVWSKSL